MTIWRTRKRLRSEFQREVEYPAGSEVALVEAIDVKRGRWFIEVRVPDSRLVGGGAHDTLEANVDDLQPDEAVSDALVRPGPRGKSRRREEEERVGVRIVLSRMMTMDVSAKDAACDLAFAARTPDEYDAAHAAMRAAFPDLVESYPCACDACVAVAKRSGRL
jgi:hypothetical protein